MHRTALKRGGTEAIHCNEAYKSIHAPALQGIHGRLYCQMRRLRCQCISTQRSKILSLGLAGYSLTSTVNKGRPGVRKSRAVPARPQQLQLDASHLSELPLLVLWRGGKAFEYTVDMRQAEFRAVAHSLGINGDDVCFHDALASEPDGEGHFDKGGLQYVEGCTAEEAGQIASRCVLVRQMHQVLAKGGTIEECASDAARFPFAANPQTQGLANGESWKVRRRDFRYKSRSRGRAPMDAAMLRALAPVTDQFLGDVDLRDPQHTLWVLKGDFANEGGRSERSHVAGSVLFSFLLAEGRDFHAYSLSDRDYLSTTTMDNETAFIMSNIAGISPGCRVCDPFCGSGGILLTAGALGACSTVGIDVDSTLEEHRIQGNFDQRSLATRFRLITGDLSNDEVIAEAIGANGGESFDAVISDPPYGRRERKRVGSDSGGRVNYQMAASDAVRRLAELCACRHQFLAKGGKLVFFVPTSTQCSEAALLVPHLPKHPSLRLLHVLRQPINNRLIRWLVVMEKVGDDMEDECVLLDHGKLTMYRKRGDDILERAIIGYDFDGIDENRARKTGKI